MKKKSISELRGMLANGPLRMSPEQLRPDIGADVPQTIPWNPALNDEVDAFALNDDECPAFDDMSGDDEGDENG